MNDNTEVTRVDQPNRTLIHQCDERSYYVAVPEHLLDEQSSLIDLLISFAFDTLGARHLDVRICAAES
jgi:hypothetical protein